MYENMSMRSSGRSENVNSCAPSVIEFAPRRKDGVEDSGPISSTMHSIIMEILTRWVERRHPLVSMQPSCRLNLGASYGVVVRKANDAVTVALVQP